jgi:hypothetical protein
MSGVINDYSHKFIFGDLESTFSYSETGKCDDNGGVHIFQYELKNNKVRGALVLSSTGIGSNHKVKHDFILSRGEIDDFVKLLIQLFKVCEAIDDDTLPITDLIKRQRVFVCDIIFSFRENNRGIEYVPQTYWGDHHQYTNNLYTLINKLKKFSEN